MNEYRKIADSQLNKLRDLKEEKARIEAEIKRVTEVAKAAINAMPDDEKGPYMAEYSKYKLQEHGLTAIISRVLQDYGSWLTPTEVKEQLDGRGYDFSGYKSNPLSSIHSILKRFKPSEVETVHLANGATGYRWKKKGKDKK